MKHTLITLLFIVVLMLSACNLPTQSTAVLPSPTAEDNRPTATLAPSPTLPPATATPETCPPFGVGIDSLPVNPAPADYVGRVYRDLPAGYEMFSGWLIDPATLYPDGKDYAIEIINRGDILLLFFEQIACNEPGGKAWYRILDAMQYPAMVDNDVFASPEVTCTLNGVPDYEILAINRSGPDDFEGDRDSDYGYQLSEVQRAWRANRATQRLEEIPLTGIVCYMEIMGP